MLSVELEQVVLRMFEDLDTSFSLKCAILWRYGEREALLRQECRAEDYDTPERYFRSVQALNLVKKLKGILDNEEERSAATLKKWWEGEVDCFKTNERLAPYIEGKSHPMWCERINQHVAGVRAIVHELVGSGLSDSELSEGRFGPGATFVDRGGKSTVPHKMTSTPAVTRDAIWFLAPFLGTAWGKAVASRGESFQFVRGNRFTTAPKTSLVDRPIAVEPAVNVFYQLAVGRALRRRLKTSHGWDLDRAQDVHRQVAQRASVTREFATLDLSNASDTVATALVRLLLPRRWFSVLDDLRSKRTLIPSTAGLKEGWRVLEKFSSMGNGFTFELETVLFAAIAIYATRACGYAGVLGWDTYVFGDDIIVRDDVRHEVEALLTFFGFRLNAEKSFGGMSPFRESCGADFYVGADVRPSYLKDDPKDVQGAFGVANRLSAAYERITRLGGTTRRRAWHYAVSRIPVAYRFCFGPKALGDNVIATEDPATWRVRWKHSIRYVQGLKAGHKVVTPYSQFEPEVVLACAVYGCGNVGTPERGRVPHVEGVHPRDSVRGYVKGWLPFS